MKAIFLGLLLACLTTLLASESFAMGSRRPPVTPPPPPPPPDPYNGQVWLAPNVASGDLLEMFKQPNLWAQARNAVRTFQFYGQQLYSDNSSECPSCEMNTFPNLVASGAFDRLKEWNIDISLEIGSVKPEDCESDANLASTKKIMDRLKRVGTKLKFIAIDEPYVSGMGACRRSAENVSDNVAKYVRESIDHHSRSHPGEELRVGLIEAYPHFDAEHIIWFLQLLKEREVSPTHFHIDFDFWAARNKRISDSQMRSDFQRISEKCREIGASFGFILWGHDGDNDQAFTDDLINHMNKIRVTFGRPESIIIQSWAQSVEGRNVLPRNLTETNPVSLTGVLMRVMRSL